MSRPRILITLDTGVVHRRGVPFADVHVKQAYIDAVERAGGTPILVAPTDNPEIIESHLEISEGLVITGGHFDIGPELYGARETVKRVDEKKPVRTGFEWALLEGGLKRGLPIVGICGGMQLLNVVLGGTLIQDIAQTHPEALDHEQATSPAVPAHTVHIDPQCPWYAGTAPIEVNTTHHQAVGRLGRGLAAWGRSPDGIIEAIGLTDRPEVCGVQWHPELLADAVSDRLYLGLVQAAAGRAT